MKSFTLRIPDEKSERLEQMAEKLSTSQNSLILSFMEIGLDSYETLIEQNRQEFLHFLSQKN